MAEVMNTQKMKAAMSLNAKHMSGLRNLSIANAAISNTIAITAAMIVISSPSLAYKPSIAPCLRCVKLWKSGKQTNGSI
jgi:hypothetical protein